MDLSRPNKTLPTLAASALAFAFALAGALLPSPARAQAGDAKETAALAAMAGLAQAEEMCALDTGFYVTLETLNDVNFRPSQPPYYDYLNEGGGTWVIRPSRGLFETTRRDLLAAFLKWKGPYTNFNGGVQQGSTPYDEGTPLDPWGQPYYLYSPLGLVRGDTGRITMEGWRDSFDRWRIVSSGPDGTPATPDDLGYFFGGGITDFVISSVNNPPGPGLAAEGVTWSDGVFTAPGGATVEIRGYNMSNSPADGSVTLGGIALPPAASWTGTTIRLTLPNEERAPAPLVVHRGAVFSNPLMLAIAVQRNAARDWPLYD